MSSRSPRKQGEDKSRHTSVGSSGDGKVSGHKGGGSGTSSRHSSQGSLHDSKSDGGGRGAKPRYGGHVIII